VFDILNAMPAFKVFANMQERDLVPDGLQLNLVPGSGIRPLHFERG